MRSKLLFPAFVILFVVNACGDNDGNKEVGQHSAAGGTGGSAGSASSVAGSAAVSPLGLCSKPELSVAECDAGELFDWKTVPVFDLSLPSDVWTNLKKNARDEQYTEAALVFEGQTLGTVGLRFKGGYGTLENCFDKSGNQTCTKLSMKLKFDKYDSTSRFFGLKHINFHSMLSDASHLHDRISYRLYREMQIVAPRSSWATVRVNGESQGIYAMVEQIDGRFTNDRWPGAGDGNLYKEAAVGHEEVSYFAEHLETNQDTATHDAFIAFSHALNTATPAERRGVVGNYTDLTYLAAYMAVDDAIYNWDGITAIYTDPAGAYSLNHNYYVYQETERPFFWVIPWDLDNTLSLSTGFGLVPNWAQTPADCSKLVPTFGGQNYVTIPGCVPLFQALSSDLTEYKRAVDRLLAGPFAEATVLASIERDAAFIREAVATDPLGPDAVSWAAAVSSLKSDIPRLRARLQRLQNGEFAVPMTLDATTINDFESYSAESALNGPIMIVNAGSTGTAVISSSNPLSGTRDLRIDFEYRNTAKAWDQWMYFSVPTTQPVVDTTGLSALRLTLRSSTSRVLRVELESSAQTATTLGIRVGWDVPVTAETQVVDLLLADAKVPSWAVSQGIDPKDDPAKIRATVAGVAFNPSCLGRNGLGFLPDGATDSGWMQMDDLQFH